MWVDIYCDPSEFGIPRENLPGNGFTAGTDFQNVVAQPLGAEPPRDGGAAGTPQGAAAEGAFEP